MIDAFLNIFIAYGISLVMPLSCILILVVLLLLQRSWANPVPDDSSSSSPNSFDLFTESSTEASLDPNLYLESLNPSKSGSDIELFHPSGQVDGLVASADFEPILVADDYCPTTNGRSRKRDSGSCPAPGVEVPLGSEIIGDYNDDDLERDRQKNPNELPGRDPLICSEIWFYFGRIFDVCCNGPFGPFILDPDARMLYRWISDCQLGTFFLYPIVVDFFRSCRSDNALICRKTVPLSHTNQRLLSFFSRELMFQGVSPLIIPRVPRRLTMSFFFCSHSSNNLY